LERQDQTIIDFVKGDFDICGNVYSSDITYKFTNGTVTKGDRSLTLELLGELYGSSNDDPENMDGSNDGPLEELGRMLGFD
jgi:hypothetical protein